MVPTSRKFLNDDAVQKCMRSSFPDSEQASDLWLNACEHLSQYTQPFRDGTIAGLSELFGLTPRMDLIAFNLVYAVGTPAYGGSVEKTQAIPRDQLPK